MLSFMGLYIIVSVDLTKDRCRLRYRLSFVEPVNVINDKVNIF